MNQLRLVRNSASALVLWASLAGTAASQTLPSAQCGSDVVAEVGQRKISLKEVDDSVGAQLASLQEKIFALRKTALNNLITKALLEEEARAQGL
jgi:hypothetical protein